MSSSQGSSDEGFPVVVSSMDSSTHDSGDYAGRSPILGNDSGTGSTSGAVIAAHDIVLEGISQVDKEEEEKELKEEFDKHFDTNQHNTI